MRINPDQINEINRSSAEVLEQSYSQLADQLDRKNIDVDRLIHKLGDFQVAIPSWALGQGGTRFGRFKLGGEPSNLMEKLEDIGLLHQLTQSADMVSLHFPWDSVLDYQEVKAKASELHLKFDAVNSNTFQDQIGQSHSYKFGSLSHRDKSVRAQAIAHNIEVIEKGNKLGSKSLTIWLADGSNFPAQHNFQQALERTTESLEHIYQKLPDDWKLFIEYKPYEPNFYSMVIQDWGTSFMLANHLGDKAYTLVDLGHHLPNTNIEQIVATLMNQNKLGGFHFNDSKYGDDDLSVGSIKPYALFLIFIELIYGIENNKANPYPAWMIDASHNTKDPLEDLIQSIEAIKIAYAKALLVDQKALAQAQEENDVVLAQELIQDAFLTDVRPLLQKSRVEKGGALNPLGMYRQLGVRQHLIDTRGSGSTATGL